MMKTRQRRFGGKEGGREEQGKEPKGRLSPDTVRSPGVSATIQPQLHFLHCPLTPFILLQLSSPFL
jgi:hypothetical protein